ncbi:hypothetical protein [Catenuloplanes niger]|uniref:hypothetical protein n=1 Tax=Catenuloplanes niger TaxID=587534 RepID=UPI00286A7F1D|nr:hypothetical protein [Catenuloplanes niger]
MVIADAGEFATGSRVEVQRAGEVAYRPHRWYAVDAALLTPFCGALPAAPIPRALHARAVRWGRRHRGAARPETVSGVPPAGSTRKVTTKLPKKFSNPWQQRRRVTAFRGWRTTGEARGEQHRWHPSAGGSQWE